MKIGIDIGGSHIAIAKVEENKIIDKKEYNYDEKFKEEIRKNIVEYIKKEVSEIIEKEKNRKSRNFNSRKIKRKCIIYLSKFETIRRNQFCRNIRTIF